MFNKMAGYKGQTCDLLLVGFISGMNLGFYKMMPFFTVNQPQVWLTW